MNLFNIVLLAATSILIAARFASLFHKLAYKQVEGDGIRTVRWGVALFLLVAGFPVMLDIAVTWDTFFLYSLPVFTLLLGSGAAIGFFSGRLQRRIEDSPTSVVKVKKPKVLFTDENCRGSNGDDRLVIDEFRFKTYQYYGVLDVGVNNVENLPDMSGKEDTPIAYQGNNVIFLYFQGVWVVIVPDKHQMTYTLNWLREFAGIRFLSKVTTEQEKEVASLAHSWVYGIKEELVLNEQNIFSLGISILIEDAQLAYANVNFLFKGNLTRAPTSAIVKMAEEVLRKTVHERFVTDIRDELSKRLKAISDIEETKKILYG